MSVREKDIWCLVVALIGMGPPVLWEVRTLIAANLRRFGHLVIGARSDTAKRFGATSMQTGSTEKLSAKSQ